MEEIPALAGNHRPPPSLLRQTPLAVPAYSVRGDVLPWDIEFGFEKGQLRLFQIRPLARYQERQTLEALGRLDATEKPSEKVQLDETP